MSTDTKVLPRPPGPVFLVGIGGIGMSGLAQLLAWQGYRVAGSDRDLTSPGRAELVAQLRGLGIEVWPQDGSGVRAQRPAALIRSAAVEAGNPDLAAAAGVPVLERAAALAAALGECGGTQIAVAGSCGKTSVTAWLDSALRALGRRVLTVCGGYMVAHETPALPGNFAAARDPEFLVYEVDESDGSLVSFRPDLGLVLNIGTDHHERAVLLRLFREFMANCRTGAVVHAVLRAELGDDASIRGWFDGPGTDADTAPGTIRALSYGAGVDGICVQLSNGVDTRVTQFGEHSAANAAAVAALLGCLGFEDPRALSPALGAFPGVRRRFERIGRTPGGLTVYDDYAHNVEKLCAAIATAQDLTPAPVHALFQPHGYGPLGFMREPFRNALARVLRPQDRLTLLPVFYAGGTTSFTPTSDEVAAEYAAAGLPVRAHSSRDAAAREVRALRDVEGVVLVLGARDPSLPAWARSLLGP